MFSNFTEKTKGWLCDAGDPYVHSNDNDIEPLDKVCFMMILTRRTVLQTFHMLRRIIPDHNLSCPELSSHLFSSFN